MNEIRVLECSNNLGITRLMNTLLKQGFLLKEIFLREKNYVAVMYKN
tara:strand:- start:2577 stop:2717 length:141 start_codon:yes stop_codon:yes gene_type:complete